MRGEVREYGRIANTPTALDRLAGKLGPDWVRLRFCYEAGPCGYGIQRQLSAHGQDCVVVAPSLIPKRAGDRIKTDRRDAASLARLHRAGELTAVWVPDPGHEALRDLVRARLDAVHALRRARQQLSGFLLRHGGHYRRPAWTKLHRWRTNLRSAEGGKGTFRAAARANLTRRSTDDGRPEVAPSAYRFSTPMPLSAFVSTVAGCICAAASPERFRSRGMQSASYKRACRR
jgi:transposase